MTQVQLPVYCNESVGMFKNKIHERNPFIMRKFDIGDCCKHWTFEHIAEKGGGKPVKVHVTNEENMNFVDKNFCYKTLPFNELVARTSRNKQQSYFLSSDERYYLRSLGFDPRGKDVANIDEHWPELSKDLKIPGVFSQDQFFSSVLRVSSSKIRMWTHYDVMDNILIQVRGRKEVILWDPCEVDNLYLVGDKSKVLDVTASNEKEFPNFQRAVQHVGVMEEGDILFIPALWFHNTLALSPSIAVNVFWKHLNGDLYDSKDPYGNKDPLPAAKALLAAKNAVKSLDALPSQYQSFYIRRIMLDLKERLASINNIEDSGK